MNCITGNKIFNPPIDDFQNNSALSLSFSFIETLKVNSTLSYLHFVVVIFHNGKIQDLN